MIEANVFRPTDASRPNTDVSPSFVSDVQYAKERFRESQLGRANPPFLLSGMNNRLPDTDGRIFRGYIRRTDIDPSDETSFYRLYFMYNPASIRRSYTAYLDQQALDPGNAMFGSNNMAAAPGIVDFSFELLFDRHIEVSQDAAHPGTKVDYDFFDLVVRGVVPGNTSGGNDIPDNGIMMVNPSNLTVVFGQEIAVKGRAYNARVRFEKFNHRMIPTRMRISITMKVFYIGPVQTVPNFTVSSTAELSKATVPYDDSIKYAVTTEAVSYKYLKAPVSSVSTSYPSPYSSGPVGPITAGVCPAGIPRGPYPLAVVRDVDTYRTPTTTVIELSGDQVYALLMAKGVAVDDAVTMWAIAQAESGFSANKAGINWYESDGSPNYDIGVWQINSVHYGDNAPEYFTDPWVNVEYAVNILQGQGFRAWSVYNNNAIDRDAALTFFRSKGHDV